MKALETNKQCCRGYNLLQMAIALIVVGFFISGFAQWYKVKTESDRNKTNYEQVQLAMSSLQDFRKLEGKYPCPASLDAIRTDPEYGHETDCTDTTSVAVGDCGNVPLLNDSTESGRVCIRESHNDSYKGAYKLRVRIGTLPFRDMRLTEEMTYDAYGNRLIYVITERQGDGQSYDENEVGITLWDQDGNLISGKDTTALADDRRDSVSHLVFSAGKDGIGGITANGQGTFPCTGTEWAVGDPLDEANCDTSQFADFTFSLQNLAEGATHYDDDLAFYSDLSLPVWKRGAFDPTGVDDHSNDIFDLAQQSVAIGAGESESLTGYAMDIQSTWSTGNKTSPYGDVRAAGSDGNSTGKIKTKSICDSFGNNCFDPALFVGVASDGDLDGTPDGECPAGKVAVGISKGHLVCQDNINVACTPPKVIGSINSNGTLNCVDAPALNCTAGDWLALDCTGHYFVAQADYPTGTIHGPGYAYDRSVTISCNNSVLQKTSESGNCTCTDSSYDSHPECNTCDYLDEPEKSLCEKKATLAGTYTVTVNNLCDTNAKSLKPKWTAAKPTTTSAIKNLKDSYALVFDGNGMTGDVPSGNVTHLAAWPNPGTTYTGGSGSWTTNCTTCAEGASDGDIRTVETGTCTEPFGGNQTKEQKFNAALCEWQDTGVSTSCSCERDPYLRADLCDDYYVRGTVTNPDHATLLASEPISYGKVRSIGVNGSCNYYDAGEVGNYCECNVGYVDHYQANPTCPDGYEMSKKEEWERTLKECPNTWENDNMVEAGACVPVNYTYKEIAPKQNPADQDVLNGISRVLGSSCPYTEAKDGTQFICKKDKGTYSCYCGK